MCGVHAHATDLLGFIKPHLISLHTSPELHDDAHQQLVHPVAHPGAGLGELHTVAERELAPAPRPHCPGPRQVRLNKTIIQ